MDSIWIVSYYDEGKAPVVTAFDNEEAAEKCYWWFLNIGHHTKVDMDKAPIYKTFTVTLDEK